MGINVKTISKKISKKRIKANIIFKYMEKTTTLYMVTCLFVIGIFSFLNMKVQFSLTSIGRENLYTIRNIEKETNEISNIKSELIKLNNILLIQKNSKELGFVDNLVINYVK